MPYIAQEQRMLLEKDLTCLANKICDKCQKIRSCLMAYEYVCRRLGIEVMTQRRYATLSAVRAVYSDASFELQRRLKIKPEKFEDVDTTSPTLNEKIKKLAEKIIITAAKSQEPHLAWPGLFNYSITILGLKIFGKKENEGFLPLAVGILEYLHKNFYEIEMAFYEDEQIIKNGDVF